MREVTKETLILADDHPLFIKGLIATLQKDFIILAIASNGIELLNLLEIHHPQGILIDLQMPYMDGLCAARQIFIHYPQIKLIILSASYEKKLECELKQAGVKAYFTKDIESHYLISQIKLIMSGGIIFYEPGKEIQFDNFSFSGIDLVNQYKLSSREFEIISLIRKGLTSKEIAKQLFISINTVEVHRKHIFKKLELKNIQGLLEFAYKYSL